MALLFPNPSSGKGLCCVELAKSGDSFCGWCDTAIAKGTPRIGREYPEQGGRVYVELMHAACAFHYDDGSWGRENGVPTRTKCDGCQKLFSKPEMRRCLSLFSARPPDAEMAKAPAERDKEAVARFKEPTGQGALAYCYTCVGAFVQEHSALLAGYLGSEQMSARVAWRSKRTLVPKISVEPYVGDPPLSKDKALKKEFLELFRCGDDKAEKLAVARHELLRNDIAKVESFKIRRQDAQNPKKRSRPE